MPDPLVPPRATARGGFLHPGCSVFPVLGLNVAVGVPVYFAAFVLAYALEDSVTWWNHVRFVAPIVVFAVLTGTLSLGPASWRHPESMTTILGFGILSSLSINAAAVGIGSVVSASSRSQGSVTAELPLLADVTFAVLLFAAAITFGVLASAVRRSAP